MDRESRGNEVSSLILKAETPVYGGYVLGRDGRIIFIRGAIPGELVEVSVEERKRDYSVASVRNVIEPSPSRREPPCRIFGICGGCQLQFMEYDKQVSMKEEILLDAMRRIGDAEVTLMPSLAAQEFGYRHRGQFKVSAEGAVGFYREGTREVIPVEHCPIMAPEINGMLRTLGNADLRGVKEISMSSGDTLAILVKGAMADEAAQALFDSGLSGIAFEDGDSLGKDYITMDLNGLKYSVTPWSFFQSHWSLNRVVVETVVRELSPLENKRILDLYAGAGNFSLPLSLQAMEIVAVEENSSAVEDGRRNVMLNGVRNCTFVNLSVEKILESRKKHQVEKLFGESHYDSVVLDPPRAGLTSECLRRIMETGSERIVYISCNPATLARDVKKMREKYEVESIRMVDFFPNTYHIEALVFLRRKGTA
ncbi:MAG: class I SAM-dependent RNA methyltransferase [Nitrospirae bacterium]|nr:class I SAM-dependent RNA methyltransferase [Nitrospirota bacterium]MCL5422094.1 class I SAM-dependent RNA methyltransferase [Nitrospirota bacterium]